MIELHEKYGTITDAYSLGDSPELAEELLALVISGRKTASCDALALLEKENIPLPKVGDIYVILDSADQPAAVIETIDVFLCRFDEVDVEFARQEGEGDLSYDYWRDGHKAYFERNGVFAPDMKLVCERYRLLEVLDRV
ncbi:ASCH domain-containing protein [uncultured Cohaesibacter sp.]|uniref:ASCH domain-containing protein n=1 Tax=uncultured Cohaesibacter sp. TaxID=1002546 RepID=UPI002931338A|nr:ASCH domain-containing protein [uncultured Cohaesibacter sp.]